MAGTKQKLTVEIDVQAKVNQAQEAINKLTKGMNDAFSVKGNAGIIKDTAKIQEAMKQLAALTSKPMDLLDFKNADKQIKTLENLISGLGQEILAFQQGNKDYQFKFINTKDLDQGKNAVKEYLAAIQKIKDKEEELSNQKIEVKLQNDNLKQAEKDADTASKKIKIMSDAWTKLKAAQDKATNSQKEYNQAVEVDGKDSQQAKNKLKVLEEEKQLVVELAQAYNDASSSGIKDVDYRKATTLKSFTDDANYQAKVDAQRKIIDGYDQVEAAAVSAEAKLVELQNSFNDMTMVDAKPFDVLKQKLKDIGLEIKDLDQKVNLSESEWVELFEAIRQGRFEEVKKTFDELGISLEEVRTQGSALANDINAGGVSLQGMTDDANRSAQAINNLKNKITQLTGLTGSVLVLRKAFQQAWQTVQELDKTMTETAVVTDFTVGDMWDQLPEYAAKAKELGIAINDVYEASTLYYQQGLKTNEVDAITTQTLKMARIAGLDAAEATDRMTNALRGFNMTLNETNATNVADVYSKLAAITASNVDEISTAMTKVASLANSANMSFENTAAFLSQIIETTRESAETAGTALKTIVARFSEIKENPAITQSSEGDEIDYNNIDKALKSVGISMDAFMKGQEGLDQVLMRLAEKWDTLSVTTQRYIATQAAGSRQQSRFIALMSDYARTQELVSAANNAAGASAQQYGKTTESLQTKLANLKTEWEKFTMAIMNSDLIKFIVDAGKTVLEVINFLTGDNGLLKVVAIVGALTLAKVAFNSATQLVNKTLYENAIALNLSEKAQETLRLKTELGSVSIWKQAASLLTAKGASHAYALGLQGVTNEQIIAAGTTTILQKAMYKLGGAMAFVAANPVFFGIAAMVAASAAIIALIKYFDSYKYAVKQATKATDEFNESCEKITDLESQIESLNDEINKLYNQGPLEITEQTQLQLLKQERAELQEQLKIEKEINKEKQKAAQQTNLNALNKFFSSGKNDIETTFTYYDEFTDEIIVETFEKTRQEQLEDYQTEIDYINDYLKAGGTFGDMNEESIRNAALTYQKGLELGITDLSDLFNTADLYGQLKLDSDETVESFIDNLIGLDEQQITKLIQEKFEEGPIKTAILNAMENGSIDIIQAINSYKDKTSTSSNTKQTTKSAISDIKTLTDNLEVLSKAYDDFNENQTVSIDTLDDISSTFSDLIGNTDLLEDGLNKVASAQSLSELKDGLDLLVTGYLNENNAIKNLDDNTKQLYIDKLKEAGVTNAQIIVEYKLSKQKIQSAKASDKQSVAEEEMAKSTGDAKDALYLYYLQQQILEKDDLSDWSESVCNSFYNIAKAAGISAVTLERFKQLYNDKEGLTYDKIIQITTGTSPTSQAYFSQLDTLIQKYGTNQALGAQKWLEDYTQSLLADTQAKIESGFGDYTGPTTTTKSTSYWENPLEKHYQLLKDINKEQRNLNKLQHEYELSIMAASGYEQNSLKQRDLLQQQLQSQLNQLKQQESLRDAYAADKQAIIDTYGSTYAEYFRKDSSGNIIGLNEQAWANKDNKIKSDSSLAETLDKIYELWTDAESGFEEAEDAIMDIESNIADQRNQAYNDYWDLIADTIDMIIERQERQLELQQEEIDNEQAANEALISTIRSNFQQLRQDRQNEKTEDEIADLTKKIAYLRQDTTGGNTTQIKELEKQLAEKKESYTDTLIDQAIDYEEQINENNIEYQQKMQDWKEKDLEYKKQTNYFESEAISLVKGMINSTTGEAKVENSDWFGLFKQINGDSNTGELYLKQKSMESSLTNIWANLPSLFGSVEQVIAASKSPSTMASSVTITDATSQTNEANNKNQSNNANNNENTARDPLTADSDEAIGIAAAILNSSTKSGWGKGEERKTKLNEKFTNGYSIVQGIIDEDSKNGYKKLNQFAASHDLTKYYYTAFATGGLADFTGPAWLDGTKSNPEIVLNAKDSENFIQLRDVLRGLFDGVATNNTSIGDSYFDIDVNVDSIASSYDLDQIAEDIKYSIYKDASYRNINNISTLK